MGYELIITEKPSAAKKIAEALSDHKLEKKSYNRKVPYYELVHNGKKIVVTCAAGHLYTVTEKNKGGWKYPVFEVEWKASHEVNKDAAFTKNYLMAIKSLAKDADSFIVATDYDIEGEVIGYNTLRFACGEKDAKRMKYSTLTKNELVDSYKNALPHLIMGQALAGTTRHELDWYYGINLSRALTLSIRHAGGGFKLLSIGRVQGPAIKLFVDKELEIRKFIPVPYWQLQLLGEKDKQPIEAWHKNDQFLNEKEVTALHKKLHGKSAKITDVKTEEYKQPPPNPFDLTSLQVDASTLLGYSPKRTLEIAQSLYLEGLISYPRTSSQKLPPTIGYKSIITQLAKLKEYTPACNILLAKSVLKPNEGPKVDEAHPAIYPTGQLKMGLRDDEKRLYDLVVFRFLATFGDFAKRQTLTVTITVESEPFQAKGIRTIEKGWHTLYGQFAKFKEVELPACKVGEEVKVKQINLLAKETTPPRRYSEASIIRELEKRNLGTKATRAQIIENLYDRGYIHEKSIQATELAIKTVNVINKYVPKILDEQLTEHFEEELDEIRTGKIKKEEVLSEAKDLLTDILKNFKSKEKSIGLELIEANKETRDEQTILGDCPMCKEGKLRIRKGKFGFFIACDKYPECKTTFKLPSNALSKPAKKICETCQYPMVTLVKKRSGPRDYCINPHCKSKVHEDPAIDIEIADIESGKLVKKCPKCSSHLVVRASIYGKFLACPGFPKCRYIEALASRPKKETATKAKTTTKKIAKEKTKKEPAAAKKEAKTPKAKKEKTEKPAIEDIKETKTVKKNK